MSEKSKIEWTGASWNPVRGCSKVSPGCKHCYAETFAERFRMRLAHGSLLLIPAETNEALKNTACRPSTDSKEPRVNVTLRKFPR